MNNQIEEMYQEFLDYKEATLCKVFSYKDMCENFINLGYQKIDKDSVVLSREEYEQLKQTIISQSEESTKLCAHLTQKIIDTRKETAEKIFNTLYQWLDLEEIEKYGFVTIQKFDFLRKFREIYKQLGVEIKE